MGSEMCIRDSSAVMLGTLFHDWGPVSPQVHEALLEGYENVRPLSEAERSWWHPLLLWWSLLMVPISGDDPTGWGRAAERLTRVLNSVEEVVGEDIIKLAVITDGFAEQRQDIT